MRGTEVTLLKKRMNTLSLSFIIFPGVKFTLIIPLSLVFVFVVIPELEMGFLVLLYYFIFLAGHPLQWFSSNRAFCKRCDMCMWLPGKGPPVCAVSGSQAHLLKPMLPTQVMVLVIFHFTHSAISI